MKESRTRILFSVAGMGLVMAALLPATVTAKRPASISDKEARYIIATTRQSLRGTCNATLKPDVVSIPGIMTVENAEPATAIGNIDKVVSEVRRMVRRQGGKLVMKERVRAIKPLFRNSRYRYRYPYRTMQRPSQPGSDKAGMPPATFVISQYFEVRLPVRANVDRVVVDLLKNGITRLGKQFSSRYSRYSRGPNVIVYYRFGKLVERLEKIKSSCIANAIRNWCVSRSGQGNAKACERALNKVRDRFTIGSLSLTAGPMMRQYGSKGTVYLRWPWQPRYLDMMELVGFAEVPVSGSIYLRAPASFGW